MARRHPSPELQKFRRLSRAGKRREAVEVLEEALRVNPNNKKARDELSRHLTGRPFSFEEVDFKELQAIIAEFLNNPQQLASMRKSALKRLRHRTIYLETALVHMLSAADKKALQQLRSAISRDLQRRRKPMSKRALAALVGLGVLLCSVTAGFYLVKRAEHAANAMGDLARNHFEREAALNLIKIHDTGLNRTLNRRVGQEVDRLRARIKVTDQHIREVDTILKDIESGKQTVVGQGVRRRAHIERRLRELGRSAGNLHKRWAELCRNEQKELKQQRLSLVEELMSPLPAWQGLTGQIEEDAQRLTARKKILQQRINIYEDAAEALKLDESIIQPALAEMKTNENIVKEINALKLMLNLLSSAHDYEQFSQMLHEFKPVHYPLAMELMKICALLPSVTSVRSMMQEHGQDLPAELLLAARESLLEGKPSFTAQFPASQEQMHLLDELLSNSALRTRLFELTNMADNLEAYSEEMPVLRNGRACFKRSALDPQRDVSQHKAVEWQNPNYVVSRTLDPRPLTNELGLDDRAGFRVTANIPRLLTKLLQHQHQDVPPLAKAYVFHYLLRVNEASEHEILTGLRYAPEMRKAMSSFDKLREDCGVALDGNCWLRRTQQHTVAERKYNQWFNKHRHLDFAGELKKNLDTLLNVTPRFAGYIDHHGEAVLFEDVRPGQLLWYLSQASVTTSGWGDPLQEPMRLSPVFIMDKDY